jgi:hypothetical protein
MALLRPGAVLIKGSKRMTDEPRPQHLDDQNVVTGIEPAAEAWQLLPVEPEVPAYVKEPLFSKKVLAAWAIGTLMVWFAITVVVPEIVRSVKSEIRMRMAEPGMNTAGERVIETPGGRIIIKRDEKGTIVVERIAPGGGPAAPVVRVTAPPAPEPPAAAPVPAPTN